MTDISSIQNGTNRNMEDMMNIPNDPIMLMSFLNTQLRDKYSSLSELTKSYAVNQEEIIKKLSDAGYVYSEEKNQFSPK